MNRRSFLGLGTFGIIGIATGLPSLRLFDRQQPEKELEGKRIKPIAESSDSGDFTRSLRSGTIQHEYVFIETPTDPSLTQMPLPYGSITTKLQYHITNYDFNSVVRDSTGRLFYQLDAAQYSAILDELRAEFTHIYLLYLGPILYDLTSFEPTACILVRGIKQHK